MTEQLIATILTENILSQVDSKGHHYQLLTEITDHKRDDRAITKVYGFIKSSNGIIHWKRMTRYCKTISGM